MARKYTIRTAADLDKAMISYQWSGEFTSEGIVEIVNYPRL